jgi:hypothetical protein
MVATSDPEGCSVGSDTGIYPAVYFFSLLRSLRILGSLTQRPQLYSS